MNTATKFGLRDNVHFEARVIEARWNEAKGKWRVRVEEGGQIVEDEAEVLINASGVLKEAYIATLSLITSYLWTS